MAAKKIKDTDYLYLSGYVHAKESSLVGRERLERMLDSRSAQDALKVLEDAGWQLPDPCGPVELEAVLSQRRAAIFTELGELAPEPAVVDVFRLRYDYHNAKCLIKAAAVGAEAGPLLSGAGRVPPEKLSAAFLEGAWDTLPPLLAKAMREANETLARTGDPQLADFLLDRAYFAELAQAGETARSPFLKGYAALQVDAANLRGLVRAWRSRKDADFIALALAEGGSVKREALLEKAETPEAALALFAHSGLAPALSAAAAAAAGGKLSELERLCDSLQNAYLSEAKLAPFGEKPVLAYLGAVEAELSAVRLVMTGHFAGLPAEMTRARLREGV